MRWIWTWLRRRRPVDEDAARDRWESERKLQEVVDMGPEVHRVAGRLNGHLARNNFAEMVQAAFGRHR